MGRKRDSGINIKKSGLFSASYSSSGAASTAPKSPNIDDIEQESNNVSSESYYFYKEGNESKYLTCGLVCVKSLLIIFNFLFIISGILLILFGLWTIYYKHDYIELSSSIMYQTSTYILMLAGAMIIITGILGIFSTWVESKRLTIMFIVILGVIFITELTSSIVAFSYKYKLEDSLKSDLELFIVKQYSYPGHEAKSKLFDELQTEFKCCGASSFVDWQNSIYVTSQNQTYSIGSETASRTRAFNLVAESCCKSPSYLCGKRTHPSNIFYRGCAPELASYISTHLVLLGLVGTASCFFQIIGLVLGSIFVFRINQQKQYDHVNSSDM